VGLSSRAYDENARDGSICELKLLKLGLVKQRWVIMG
jgi:hypothetical protein